MKNIHETINNSIAAAKKMKSIEDWINKLSYKEQHYMETIINANVNENLKILADSVTNAITDFLYEHNFDVKAELDKLEVKINAENDMITKYLKRGEDYMKMLDKDKEKIINDYKEMIKESSEKVTMKNLIQDYSAKYSASAVRNVINEYKDSLKEEKVDNNADNDKEIEEALEYIFGEEQSANKDDGKEENKDTVLRKAGDILRDDEGTLYYKIDNTVTVGTMTFKDENDLEKFREKSIKEYKEGHDNALSERRKQYEEEIAEINRAYEEEKIKFLKKINNIADVMAM